MGFESRPRHGCLSLVNVARRTGRSRCDGPVPRPGESYRVCMYMDECDQVQQVSGLMRKFGRDS